MLGSGHSGPTVPASIFQALQAKNAIAALDAFRELFVSPTADNHSLEQQAHNAIRAREAGLALLAPGAPTAATAPAASASAPTSLPANAVERAATLSTNSTLSPASEAHETAVRSASSPAPSSSGGVSSQAASHPWDSDIE